MTNEKYPTNDKELERKAAQDKSAREELKEKVRATSLYQAHFLIKHKNLDYKFLDTLIEKGLQAFDVAFNLYVKNGNIYDENANFSPYFGWFARQKMIEYLDTEEWSS